MAYSEFLGDRIRERLKSKGSLLEKKMMGGLLFMVNNKMCIAVGQDKKTKVDRLMIRLGKAAYEELLQREGCRTMDFTGKPMKGYLYVYPEGFDNETDLDFWVNKALDFNKEIKDKK